MTLTLKKKNLFFIVSKSEDYFSKIWINLIILIKYLLFFFFFFNYHFYMYFRKGFKWVIIIIIIIIINDSYCTSRPSVASSPSRSQFQQGLK